MSCPTPPPPIEWEGWDGHWQPGPPPPHVDSAASAVSQAITARPTYVYAGPSRVGKGTDQGPQPASFSPCERRRRDPDPGRSPSACRPHRRAGRTPSHANGGARRQIASQRTLSTPSGSKTNPQPFSLVSCVSGVPSRAHDNDPGPPVDRRLLVSCPVPSATTAPAPAPFTTNSRPRTVIVTRGSFTPKKSISAASPAGSTPHCNAACCPVRRRGGLPLSPLPMSATANLQCIQRPRRLERHQTGQPTPRELIAVQVGPDSDGCCCHWHGMAWHPIPSHSTGYK